MNIAVYCGSASGNRPSFTEGAKAHGSWIAQNGHTLVFIALAAIFSQNDAVFGCQRFFDRSIIRFAAVGADKKGLLILGHIDCRKIQYRLMEFRIVNTGCKSDPVVSVQILFRNLYRVNQIHLRHLIPPPRSRPAASSYSHDGWMRTQLLFS